MPDNKWIRDKNSKNITINIDTSSLINSAKNLVNLKDFAIFKTFFSGKTRDGNMLNPIILSSDVEIDKNGNYILTQNQFADLFYVEAKAENEKSFEMQDRDKLSQYLSAKNPLRSITFYNRGLDDPDFARRAFIFGSTTLGIDTDNIRYVLDKNLNPIEVRNARIKLNPKGDNFDFFSNDGIASLVNPTLANIIDPSRIGRTVNMKFDIEDIKADTVNFGTVSKARYDSMFDYDNIAKEILGESFLDYLNPTLTIIKASALSAYLVKITISAFKNIYKEFKNNIVNLDSIKYIDENGKFVMYDGSGDGKLNGTILDDGFDLSKDIKVTDIFSQNSIYNIASVIVDGILVNYASIKLSKETIISNVINGVVSAFSSGEFDGGNINPHKDKLKNGITYIGGKGSDTIIGTEFDDILYSNDKSLKDDNSPDILKGGDGYDTYYANDKDIITDSDGKGEVYFNNTQLIGGILDKDKSSNSIKVYLSEDKNIEYHLDENSKVLKVIDKNNNNAELTINNFNKEEKSLNINLADNLGKEVAIVIDTTGSMWDDIETTKSKALTIAKNIFRENSSKDLAQSNTFSKISIVTFSDNNIKTIGTYYNYNSFQSGINSVNIENGGTEYHCAAMIEGMSNFTKDNGLDKQIFLMTDESGDDNHRMDEVIAMANNFGKEMTTFTRMMSSFTNSSKIIYDNSVKINVISINSNLSHLKRLSDETGGLFLQPNSLNELEDALFDASNLGTNKSETIIGNNKNNIIEGKGGDDILQGKEGSDTYIFKDKFDKDIIIETNKNNIDKNKIDLSSFSIKDAKFKVDNNDLTITIIDTKKDSFITALDKISHNITKFLDLNFTEFKDINIKDSIKGSITIKEFFNKDELKISTIKFSDFLLDESAMKFISKSKNKNQNLNILSNDFINENLGDDLYIFTKNSGKISLQDNSIFSYNDRIIFSDFSKKDAKFFKEKDDLIVKFNDDNILKIKDANSLKNRVENFEFKDEILSLKDVNKIVQDLNSYSNDKSANFVEFMGEKNQSNLQLFS
ncbi:VWA domain-containing protein [Campylobacter ureolyticus]|uniref:VWA domain-containing protein n=4 Tax=Campylobacter ureolyticus TaxID=827 RepID=UPI0022B561FC|nr:VWA domain-containing protein [Campylobacter ureolyticus]MCZ6174311.1 VWA domain-containing protein [Campylobacter ureolyticus]